MEFFRAGEALLRSSQPVLPFLAPAVYRPRLPCSAPTHQLLRSQTARPLTTSRACLQQEPASKAPEGQDKASSGITPEFGQLLDSVLRHDKTQTLGPAAPSSRSGSAPTQRFGSMRRETSPAPKRSAAISELLDMFAKPSASTQARPRPGGSFDIAAMLDPNRNVSRPSAPPPSVVPPPAPMKLNSSVGRTVQVDPGRGMDVARAFRALEIQCARNKVKKDFMAQRFHERPGLKRKRLKRERWRRRFKANFVATVKMVQRMKSQGW